MSADKVGPETKKILDKWRKIFSRAPKKIAASDLSTVTVPSIKMHIALAKLEKQVKELQKQRKKMVDDFNRKLLTAANVWSGEIDNSLSKNITVDEIPSRKTMLIGKGMEVSQGLKLFDQHITKLANAAIAVENDAENVKGELRKAEKALKKSQTGKSKQKKKAKGSGNSTKVKILGKQLDVQEEDLKGIGADLKLLQQEMIKLGKNLTKQLVASSKDLAMTDDLMKKIRSFKHQ